ncbi:MAG: hypothetical protein CMJ30_01895 [Phycisphaerae bacterium]|nr:hypothetical protein [Phycisphaerae bacterium]
MHWPSLILAGLLSGLNTSDGVPISSEVPTPPPAARRVLIPTWELVVPVLQNSTPILEQNGPDSVVLMTEISESPRWMGTIRVVQLNAQTFATATQSFIESYGTSEKNKGHAFFVDSDRSIDGPLGATRAVWALSASPSAQWESLKDAMVGLIFVPFGEGACILGEFRLAAALGDAKRAECESIMLGCTGPTPESLALERTQQLQEGGRVLNAARGKLADFAHRPRWYRHFRRGESGSQQDLGVTVTWAFYGPPPSSLETETERKGLHVHQQTLTGLGTREAYSEHFDGWVQDDLGLETFGLNWTKGESVWKSDGSASGLFERTSTNTEYILSAGDFKTATRHNRVYNGLPESTLPMSLRMLTGQLLNNAPKTGQSIRWYAPILSSEDVGMTTRRDRVEPYEQGTRVTWTPRQGEPATVDEFDANGVLQRRIFPDGSEMIRTEYVDLVQAWRLAGLPTELLQEGKARYANP